MTTISERGKGLYEDPEGFLYTFENQGAKGKEIWRCELRRVCNGRIHVKDGEVIKRPSDHSHLPNPTRKEARHVKRKMKDLVMSTQRNPHEVAGLVLESASDPCLASLPRREHIRRTLRATRRKSGKYPAEPEGTDFEIPLEFMQHLKYDSGPGDKRILIFGSDTTCSAGSEGKHFFADGTFKASPSQFSQIYSLHLNTTIDGWSSLLPYACSPTKARQLMKRCSPT
ncbi:MAG: hypothetical protein GY696_11730 [Gammaproteobacteria bacterium]|nr:hypothetical protein [Gammaproteobacteria bacterium]